MPDLQKTAQFGILVLLLLASFATATAQGDPDRQRAFQLYKDAQYVEALPLFEQLALKYPEDGAREGAPFIREHIIRVTPHAFDDFAASGIDAARNKELLGLGRGK